MPTYQYVCTNPEVKHEFERVQSFSDPAVSACPDCGAPVRKVYGSVGVVFKGSGFYRTDSRKPETAGTATATAGKNGAAGTSKDTAGSTGSSTPSTSSSTSASGSAGKAAN